MVNFSSNYIKSFTELLQKNVTNMVMTTEQSASQFCNLSATVKIKAGGDITIDGNVTASARGVCDLKTMFSSDSKMDFAVQMSSVLDKTISQDTTQESSLIGFLQANVGFSRQDIETRLKNVIERNLTQETIQKALQSASVSADNEITAPGNITIHGNVGSEVQAQIVGNFIADSVSSAIAKDEMVQKADESMEQKTKQKEETLSGALFYIVFAVILALFAIFILPSMLLSGGGDSGSKPGGYQKNDFSEYNME